MLHLLLLTYTYHGVNIAKEVKTDYTLAKLLSYNCYNNYTINLQNLGDIAKDIYDNTLLLEGSTCSYKQDTFLDLHRRRSKKISKLRVTDICVENSPVTSEFPPQRDSNAENVSIWWRHLAGSID